MSRSFAASSTDLLTFAAGLAPPDEGPITVLALIRATDVNFTGWAVQGRKVSSGVWSVLVDSGKLFIENDFGSGGPAHGTGWLRVLMEKPSGSVKPRWHVKDITNGTAWIHQDGTANVGDGSGPIDNILVGGDGSTSHVWRGEIGMLATWAGQPFASDAAVEALDWDSAAAILAEGPDWMVRFNQTDVTTVVTDDTGNGGDQTARVGTSVGADDPPGFDYSLAPPAPAEGSAAFTLDLAPAAQGARTAAGAAALALGLGADVDGSRASSGAAALALALDLAATGERTSGGSAAFTLDLALAAAGAGEVSCLPFPWTCSDVPGFAACVDLPAFPGTCSPVPSFLEVTP